VGAWWDHVPEAGGFTFLRLVASNAGVGDHDRAADKALEGDDRQTDTHTHTHDRSII